jgi:uncharacterized protein (DUF362 family)
VKSEAKAPAATGTSRVIVAHDPAVIDESWTISRARLEKMVDESLIALTGASSAEKAWAALFSSDERVGLKPNGLGGMELATAVELTGICIDRLTSIGLKAENLVVWEQDPTKLLNCGFEQNASGSGVRKTALNGNFSDPVQQGAFTGRLSRIVTDEVDAILCLPIMKDHTIAGVTLALKNHYGSCDRPWDLHGGGCNPACADLNAVPAIKGKTRLVITDATRALYDGGPSANPANTVRHGRILVAKDPVAHDHVGWAMIEDLRKENGLRTLEEAGRPPRYIQSAAELGLGTNDPSRIETIVKELG